MNNITVYTDGACYGGKNQVGAANEGGWGAVFFQDELCVKMLHNHSENTTNNREELKAILEAGKALLHMATITDGGISATIYSDSAYCVNIINQWMFKWHKAGWKKADKKEPENLDLITALYELFYNNYTKIFPKCQINVVKLAGHCGIIGNELADALATHNTKKIEKIFLEHPEILNYNINELDKGENI